MKGFATRLPVEIAFAAAMVGVMVVVSAIFVLPMRLPSRALLVPLLLTYLVPLAGAVGYSILALMHRRRPLLHELAVTLPCFWVVLIVTFNLKLWVPFVNPHSFDAVFWMTDQALRPLVTLCMAARRSIAPVVPYDWNFYLTGFLLLFYLSLLYHATRTPRMLRRLIVSATFLQGFGGLVYLALPAIGPFLYEAGVSSSSTAAQRLMLDVRTQSVAHGRRWLSDHGASVLMAGLGAMPSLHVGYAFLFLRHAIRDGRVLLPTYIPIFLFILVTSVANRWHYLVDLPVGLALAALSIRLAWRYVPPFDAGAEVPEREDPVGLFPHDRELAPTG